MARVQAITYGEYEENRVIGILAPNINGEEYVKSLNSDIDGFNADVEAHRLQVSAIKEKHKCHLGMLEVTGNELLNEREPKYPKDLEKGQKSHQIAYPEITAERERRRLFNIEHRKLYNDFMNDANEKALEEIKPLVEVIRNKWPNFKSFIGRRYNDYDCDKIWSEFELTTFNYIEDEATIKV